MYIVVEVDPVTGEQNVLFPRLTLIQIHATLESAKSHRDWYIENVYVEDPEAGGQAVGIYALRPVRSEAPSWPALRTRI